MGLVTFSAISARPLVNMEQAKMVNKGKLYNISLDGKKMVRGWLLLVTEEGEEFLVKRNFSFGAKIPWKIYKTNFLFKNKCLADDTLQYSKSNQYGLALAIPISALIRAVIPSNYFFGELNQPIDISQGLMNILFVTFCVGLSIACLMIYRHQKLIYFLKSRQAELKYIGKIDLNSPTKIQENGVGFW